MFLQSWILSGIQRGFRKNFAAVVLIFAGAISGGARAELIETGEIPSSIPPDSTQNLGDIELDVLAARELGECHAKVATSPRSNEVRGRLLGTAQKPGPLRQQLARAGFNPGDRVFFRIFKQSVGPDNGLVGIGKGYLEAWIQAKDAKQYSLFKVYPLVVWGGTLGPKLKEGDGQSPEGFYGIHPESMNPFTQLHLSMNVGYPNAFDRSYDRTGGLIMIHAGEYSAGCYVLNIPNDEEVYVLAEAALMRCAGEVPVAVFPFPMTDENLKIAAPLPWYSFWQNLAEGYGIFEREHRLPEVRVSRGRYLFQ